MRKSAFLMVLSVLALLTIGAVCNGEPSEPPKEEKFETFSFAVITDLKN